MDINFRFQHNRLSALELRSLGIINTKELEEVILGESFWEEINIDDESIVFATGFTLKVKALKIAFKYDENMTIHTLQAAPATVEEIKSDFCKFCK
jgi:DNA-binding MltR family transcriptional regulator